MRRYGYLPAAILVAALLTAGAARPAMALNHVAALRSGKLIIAVPAPVVFAMPERSHTYILPILIGTPITPSETKAYASAGGQLQSAADNIVLKPYAKRIETLPLRKEFLSFARKTVLRVSWINSGRSAAIYEGQKPLDAKRMRRLTFAGNTGAVVFIRPIIVFTRDFKQVYIITAVTVYAWGPVRAFFMGSENFYASVSLNRMEPELKTYGIEGLAASKREGMAATEARARVWFARDATRLKLALAIDMEKLQKSLSSYLDGHS
jgi:hypothetical protein